MIAPRDFKLWLGICITIIAGAFGAVNWLDDHFDGQFFSVAQGAALEQRVEDLKEQLQRIEKKLDYLIERAERE